MIRHLPPFDGDENDAGIGGVLQLEDDCLCISGGLNVRSPVVWPAGTRWDAEQEMVITPSGDRIRIGNEIAGSGGHFDANGLEPLVGSDGAELAERCVDNPHGEIAIANNNASAIGLAR